MLLRRAISAFAVALVALATSCSMPYEDVECDVTPHIVPTPSETIRKYKIVIHKDVPGHKVGPIMDAASEWSTVTGGAFVFEVTYADFDTKAQPVDGEMRVFLAPKTDPKSGIIGTATWWGAKDDTRPRRAIIWIEDILDARTHYLVALHEFGHALGLGHSQSEGSIMYPSVRDVGAELPCEDRQAVCKLWACQPGC